MKHAIIELNKSNEELLFYFEINQILVRIIENKDASYADYTS